MVYEASRSFIYTVVTHSFSFSNEKLQFRYFPCHIKNCSFIGQQENGEWMQILYFGIKVDFFYRSDLILAMSVLTGICILPKKKILVSGLNHQVVHLHTHVLICVCVYVGGGGGGCVLMSEYRHRCLYASHYGNLVCREQQPCTHKHCFFTKSIVYYIYNLSIIINRHHHHCFSLQTKNIN